MEISEGQNLNRAAKSIPGGNMLYQKKQILHKYCLVIIQNLKVVMHGL